MSPGERIRRLRIKNRISQKELSNDLGYKTYTTISKWESDSSLPPGKEIKNLATYFDVTTDYILGLNDYENGDNMDNYSNVVDVDLHESTHANEVATKTSQVKIPSYILDETPHNYFIITVQTDSMNRIIPSGNRAIIKDFSKSKDTSFHTGDILLVNINDEIKLEHIRKTDSKIYLEPFSYLEGFDTITYDIDEFDEVEIIGKVVHTYRRF